MRLRLMTINPAAMSSMLMIGVASLMAPTVHADEGLESSLAVLELYVGDGEYAKTPDYALRVTESISEMGKFAVLSRSDTASQVSKSVTSSGRRDTEDKLKQIEQALKQGDQLVYENPRKAIEVLGRAKSDLIMIMDQLSLNKKIRKDLFLTQMLLARSHFDNKNRDKAQQIMAEIIRVFGDEEKVTDDEYHPNIVALYRETYRQLSEQRTAVLSVRTEPAGAEILINGQVQEAPSPATYEGLYPGPVTVIARKDGRESLVHKLELSTEAPTSIDIDIDFETATAFDGERFGLVFPDTATLDQRIGDFAGRIGKMLSVDYVLVTGLVERDGEVHIEGHLIEVATSTVSKEQSLVTKANVISNNRVVQLAQFISGWTGASSSGSAGPWYTNWVGWTLAGTAAVSGVVGIVMMLDYQSANQAWVDAGCTAPNKPWACTNAESELYQQAEAGNTSSTIATAMGVVAGAAAVGSVLAFLLMDSGDSGGAASYEAPQLKLQYVGPTMLPGNGSGVGMGFTF
ncbi:MAG: hypothetical protein ACPGU1_05405 [Myxococcota bacterium]